MSILIKTKSSISGNGFNSLRGREGPFAITGKILKFAMAKIVAKSDTSACGLTVAQYICDRFAKISIYCCVGQSSVVFRDLEPFKWDCFRAHKIENDQSQLSTAIICVSMPDLVSKKRIFNTIIYKPRGVVRQQNSCTL